MMKSNVHVFRSSGRVSLSTLSAWLLLFLFFLPWLAPLSEAVDLDSLPEKRERITKSSPFSPSNIKYHLTVKVEVPGVRRSASSGAETDLRLWIPYPAHNSSQKILSIAVDSPYPWQITKENQYGNKMLFIKGKARDSSWVITINMDVERRIDVGTPPEKINGENPLNPKNHLGPTLWIPFSDEIVRIAGKETRGRKTSFQKIRALYDYIYDTMTYNKDGEGWGQGDPIWACSNKRGNCTDFHSLFIALARSQNIPARFEIGLPIPHDRTAGQIPGYHCWAQAFDPVQGWIPLDASESKKRGEKDLYFNKLGQDRILFSVGRGITLNPPQKGASINYFFSPYSEMNGKRWDAVKASYVFRKIEKSDIAIKHGAVSSLE